MASVYLPCAGCSREQYTDALLDLQDDVVRRSMTAPPCIGPGRNRSAQGEGASVVDHVLRVRGDATRTLALPACATLDHATHGPALQLLASDHCPVLFFCASRALAAKAKRSTRITWRLDLLRTHACTLCVRMQQTRSKHAKRTRLSCGRARMLLHLRAGLQTRATTGGLIECTPR